MKREKKDKNFLHKPHYPGGNEAMKSFIKQHMRYPELALKEKVEGVVQLRVTINDSGKVIHTEVVHSIGYGCDEEAERVIKMMRFEVSKNRGVKAKFHKKMNIHFKLPTPNPQQTTAEHTQVAYAYTTSKKENEQKPEPKSYNYTIKTTTS